MSHWAIAPGQQLRHRCWQNEHVVYNDLSGDTHLLSDIAWEVLSALNTGPAGSADLARCLGLDGDLQTASHLEHLLASLHQLGLVEAR